MKKILMLMLTLAFCSILPLSATALPPELAKYQELFDQFDIDFEVYVEIQDRINAEYGTEFYFDFDKVLELRQKYARKEGLPEPTMEDQIKWYTYTSPEEFERINREQAIEMVAYKSKMKALGNQNLLYSSEDKDLPSLAAATFPVTKDSTATIPNAPHGIESVDCSISGNIELLDQQGYIWNSVTSGWADGMNAIYEYATAGYHAEDYTWSPVDFKRSIEVRYIGFIKNLHSGQTLATNVYTNSVFYAAQP